MSFWGFSFFFFRDFTRCVKRSRPRATDYPGALELPPLRYFIGAGHSILTFTFLQQKCEHNSCPYATSYLLDGAERCPVGNIRDKNFNAISDVAFSPVSVCLCITPQTLKCRPAGFMIAFAYLRQPALAIGDWSLLITRSAIPCSAPRLLAMLSPEKNRWTPWLHPAA